MKAVLIPMKDPSRAKTRLAGLLSIEERRRLVWAMFEDVSRALAASSVPDRIVMVTSFGPAIARARAMGWDVLVEQSQVSESASVDWASGVLAGRGFDLVMRLPADLPLVKSEDIDEVLSVDLGRPTALLVPSRDGTGTNAIIRAPANLFPSRFGPNSLALHIEEAARAGVRCEILENDRIALDIDEPEDLRLLLERGRGTATFNALTEMSIQEKVSGAGCRVADKREDITSATRHPPEVRVVGVEGLPEISEGDNLPRLIREAVRRMGFDVRDGDVFVVAQKIVSKAEGRVVRLDSVTPSRRAVEWAEQYAKDARAVEVVLGQSRRVVRMEQGVMICETHHGFVCANAGVDASNTAEGTVVLLPVDPDLSARRIQSQLESEFGVRLAVIVSDTFGRPWREGLVNVALGVAGIAPLVDYRGQTDSHGQLLKVTVIALADELASAAELVMKKTSGIPVAVIRGFDYDARRASGAELIRPPARDLFR